jgi:hypothetical protein
MNPNARITYRFDGKSNAHGRRQAADPLVRDTEAERKVVPLYPEELQFTQDVAPWKSPFQDDPHALERLIREMDGHVPREARGRSDNDSSRNVTIVHAIEQADELDPLRSLPREGYPRPIMEQQERTTPLQPLDAVPLGDADSPVAQAASPVVPRIAQPAAVPTAPSGNRVDASARQFDEGDLGHAFAAADSGSDGQAGLYTGYLVQRRRTGPSWFKVIASVAGALVTGALFGYVVLSLFADQASPEATNAASVNETNAAFVSDDPTREGIAAGAANDVQGGPAVDHAAPEQPDAASMLAVHLPERHYAMLQFGVFSSVEGMNAALAELKDKGYAAAADTLNGFRVYAGIAPDKTEASALGEQLDVAELFVKTIQIPAVEGIGHNGTAEEVIRFMNASDAYIRTAGDLTAAALSAGEPEPLSDMESADWRAAYEEWSEAAAVFGKGTIAAHRDDYTRLSQAVEGVSAALEAYEKSVSRMHLWTAQAQLMEAVFAWKEWMERF